MQQYSFPKALTDIGAVGEEGHPAPAQPFYRLSGATVRRGISAFMVVTVIGKNGTPLIGGKVVNLFPDGNGEVIETDGSGTARFQFGASSAFSNPGSGPFTVFLADDSAFKDSDSVPKRVVYQARTSDIAHSLGDYQGTHTEIYIQFVEQSLDAPAPAPPVDIPIVKSDDELRNLAYNALNISYNPDAALMKWAHAHGFGVALASESKYTDANGQRWVWQPFVLGIVRCREGDYANIHKVAW